MKEYCRKCRTCFEGVHCSFQMSNEQAMLPHACLHAHAAHTGELLQQNSFHQHFSSAYGMWLWPVAYLSIHCRSTAWASVYCTEITLQSLSMQKQPSSIEHFKCHDHMLCNRMLRDERPCLCGHCCNTSAASCSLRSDGLSIVEVVE